MGQCYPGEKDTGLARSPRPFTGCQVACDLWKHVLRELQDVDACILMGVEWHL